MSMDDEIDCLPAFPAILLRPGEAQDPQAVATGLFISTAHTRDSMLVNGHELHAREPGRSLMAGIFYARRCLGRRGEAGPAPRPGDLIGMKVREGLVVAYAVLLAGPGLNPRALGSLSSDAVACELRPELGSIHKLSAALDESLLSHLH
jgi:hypothetical protein